MKPKDHIDQLQRIQKVTAPTHLLNRIHARIDAEARDKITPTWMASIAAAFVLLALFNVLHLKNSQAQYSNTTPMEVTHEINLLPSNQLYHE